MDEFARLITASKQYARFDADFVLRFCEKYRAARGLTAEAAARGKEHVKAVKSKLREISGAFCDEAALRHLARLFDANANPGALEAAALQVHASTRERLPHQDEFYALVAAHAGTAESVLDLGCGLHPFALRRMGLPHLRAYNALDIDAGCVSLVNRWLVFNGLLPGARAADAADGGLEQADLVFACKLLPTLERQGKGLANGLLASLRAKHVVVTFPARSLSGRGKGMERGYAEAFEQSPRGGREILEKRRIGVELVYILR